MKTILQVQVMAPRILPRFDMALTRIVSNRMHPSADVYYRPMVVQSHGRGKGGCNGGRMTYSR